MEYTFGDDEDIPYGNTPGDSHITDDGSDANQLEMPVERKLQLAERANEIYREQVKYLQDHLNGMRALMQDKESIIENLVMRYDLQILPQDMSNGDNILPDKIEDKEMRRKAEALAQRTILENFELRELVNELRDENFQLRNEIYDLQDKINRQALHISKITKNIAAQTPQPVPQPNAGNGSYPMNGGVHPDALSPDAQRKREEREQKQHRRQSSVAQPKDFFSNENEEEEEADVDADANENNAQEANNTNGVLTTQEMFGQDEEQVEDDYEEEDEEAFMDENAKKKREERQQQAHKKQITPVIPNNFFDDGYTGDGAPSNDNDNDNGNDNDNDNDNDRPAKRRGSQKFEEDPRETEEAKAKRQERAQKEHNRQESGAAPNLFENDYANTEEAKKLREERAKKARKESVAVPKAFLKADMGNDSEDDASRQQRRKHQRKQSLMKAVGDKGHLSDEDTEKTQHVDYEYESRRKLDRNSVQKGKETGIAEQSDTTHDRRESSMPAPNLGLEDPAVQLAATEEELKALKDKLTKLDDEKKEVEKQKKEIEKQLQDNKQETQQLEQKLGQQLEKKLEEKFQKEKNGLVESNKKEINQMNTRISELSHQLNQVASSKVNLIQCTSSEINRLNRIINGLLQNDKCKEITLLLLDDSTK